MFIISGGLSVVLTKLFLLYCFIKKCILAKLNLILKMDVHDNVTIINQVPVLKKS